MERDQIKWAMTLIQEKAAQDKEFRGLCLTSPREAIKVATAIEIPEGMDVRFAEGNGGQIELVMAGAASALSDTDLDSVAGGGKPGPGPGPGPKPRPPQKGTCPSAFTSSCPGAPRCKLFNTSKCVNGNPSVSPYPQR